MLRIRLFLFLLFGVISLNAYSQTSLQGEVYDSGTKEVLPNANVYWSETLKGTTSDESGRFTLVKDNKAKSLVISYTGYINDTIDINSDIKNIKVYLKTNSTSLSQVSIVERQASTYISKISLDKKEYISAEGLKHLACCNLGESFENSATVDVGYSDAVTGSKQIQLLGLTGV